MGMAHVMAQTERELARIAAAFSFLNRTSSHATNGFCPKPVELFLGDGGSVSEVCRREEERGVVALAGKKVGLCDFHNNRHSRFQQRGS